MPEILTIEGFALKDGKAHERLDSIDSVLSSIHSDLEQIENELNSDNAVLNLVKSDISFLDGKKLLIIGDSTTDNDTFPPNWVELLKRKISADSVNCYVDTSMCNDGDSFCNIAYNDLPNLTGITETFDYVMIQLGLNDCTGQYRLGKHSDTTAMPDGEHFSVIGCFNVIVNAIKSKWPNAIIFYNMPTQNQFGESEYSRQIPLCVYRAAYGEVCKRYGIRIIDNSLAPMLSPLHDTNGYITDGLHPTAKYAPIFLDYIIKQMSVYGGSTWANLHTNVNKSFTVGANQVMRFELDSYGKIRLNAAVSISQSYENGLIEVCSDFPSQFAPAIPFIAIGGDGVNLCPVEVGFIDNGDNTHWMYVRHLTGNNNYLGSLYINFEYEVANIINKTTLSI